MKLTELIKRPIEDVLRYCDVVKLQPITDDKDEVVKIIVEYTPNKGNVPSRFTNEGDSAYMAVPEPKNT